MIAQLLKFTIESKTEHTVDNISTGDVLLDICVLFIIGLFFYNKKRD